MILSITGTPGTGKTEVSSLLRKKINNSKVISITSLLKTKKITSGYDNKRKCWIVNLKKLQKEINKLTDQNPDMTYIIDGHLSHFLKSDYIFILRCNPNILEKRLKRKGWSKVKIRENVEAEMVDVIKYEAFKMKKSKKIIELDNTKGSTSNLVKIILKNLN